MKLLMIILITLFSISEGMCQETAEEEQMMLESLRKMRVKQQNEEGTLRIQHFINQQTEQKCTPVQMARQRVKDIEEARNDNQTENVNITAGHGELNVTDNSGTVNSNINIQIVKQGEEKECL